MESEFATQRVIQDIKTDDVRIQVKGYVKNAQNGNNFILDDKSGELTVDVGSLEAGFEYKEGDLVNVIGDLRITTSGEKILDAEIIQDMTDLNFDDYKKLYHRKKEILEKENL